MIGTQIKEFLSGILTNPRVGPILPQANEHHCSQQVLKEEITSIKYQECITFIKIIMFICLSTDLGPWYFITFKEVKYGFKNMLVHDACDH